MKPYMGYFYAVINYLKTDKARYDIMDYTRAAIIIAAVMAVLSILFKIGVERF